MLSALSVPPPMRICHFTITPGAGIALPAFRTTTTNGAGSSWATVSVCGSPEITTTSTPPGTAVTPNTTKALVPASPALIESTPGAPSVKVICASPLPLVNTVSAETTPPPTIRVHATRAPATGLLAASATRTTSGSASTFPAVSLCASPLTLAIVTAGPALAVAWKVTGATPAIVAV